MKIAILSLASDAGHTNILLHIGKLLQDNGISVRFFGSSDNNSLCQYRNISYSTFFVEKPPDHIKNLAILSATSRFWREAIVKKWFYINYYEKENYFGIRKEAQLFKLVQDFKPCAILADSRQFTASSERIASILNCPLIFNSAYGNYSIFQSEHHLTNFPFNPFTGAFLIIFKKLLGKGLTEYTRLFYSQKFNSDQYINKFITDYWDKHLKTNLTGLPKLTISCGTGILEKKYLYEHITIPDRVFQVGPIAYTPAHLLSDDLSDWLKLDSRPVIFVCLGTMVKGVFPFFNQIVQASVAQGYRVLWSYYVKPWKNSMDSVDLRWEKWVSQLDILAHKKVKIFISHCGSGAIRQALWFCKPVIGIPFLWDQFYNAWVIEKLCGIPPLDKENITVKAIISRLRAVQSNKSKFQQICTEFRNNEGSKLLIDKIVKHIN